MQSQRATRYRYPAIGSMLSIALLILTGCVGAGGEPKDPTQGDAGVDVAQAKVDFEAVVEESPTIEVAPISGPIPKGLTIDYLACALAVCTNVGIGVEDAASALGWNVNVVTSDSTPSGYQDAWNQIAQSPGDGVVNSSPVLPYSAVAVQTEKAGVPIVSSTSPDPVGGHLIGVVSGTEDVKRQGGAEANWVIRDAGAPVDSLFVYDPSIPAIASALPGYQEAMAKNCSACAIEVLEVSASQIGPALAQQVVSYLQANPDTKYVAFGLGDLATGVPAAIEASGLQDQVSLTTRAATPTNVADVQNGGMASALTTELFEAGWRSVDMLVRQLTDTPIEDQYPLGLTRLITQDDLPADVSVPFSVPGYQDPFEAAWGLR